MKCESCGSEIPEQSQEITEWVIEQREKRILDETIYGHSCSCADCGKSFNPTDCIDEPHGVRGVEWGRKNHL